MENKNTKAKSYRIWGWIFMIVGGLSTLIGGFCMVLVISELRDTPFGDLKLEVALITLLALIVGITGLVIGIPYFVLGTWRIFHKNDEKNRRLWGWIFIIIGGISILWGIFCILGSLVLMILVKKIIPLPIALFWGIPGLVTGILIFNDGIRDIIRMEKKQPQI